MKKIFLLAFILLCTGSSVLFSQVMGYVMVVHQAGCDNQSGILKAQFGGGNGVYTYLWSNGSTNDTIYDLSAGIYTVTCYSNGQTGTATVNCQHNLD